MLMVGVDILSGTLRYAKRVAREYQDIVLVRANASHPPLKDGHFDGIFNTDGINTFGEKALAMKEMFRVARFVLSKEYFLANSLYSSYTT